MLGRAQAFAERAAQLSPNAAAQQAARQGGAEANPNYVDVGYDTDTIAIFEIDKAFTDYLLCQICFSKYPNRHCLFFPTPDLNSIFPFSRNEQRRQRVRLLQQTLLQIVHRELVDNE
mmetsp:Transcript_44179/g.58640  ORF Transcript_44179/g.58640 Transcript_44179/m.58640 type:complete len:117 (+) Transcript_44179:649-999(+)